MKEVADREQNTESRFAFSEGAQVVYGFHGRCEVKGIETRKVGDEVIRFYKLEKQRPQPSRTKKREPFIFIPIARATQKGLRKPISQDEIDLVWEVLGNREYYFSLDQPWPLIQKELESAIYESGVEGLAKVVSFLYVYSNRKLVPPSAAMKFRETVNKLLARELAEILDQPIRVIEEDMEKKMKVKLRPDH